MLRKTGWIRCVLAFAAAIIVAAMSLSMAVDAPTRLRLATTTSTDNTGLLDYILPGFEKRFNVKVDVIAVGTGKALRLAQDGNVDVVMVHAPAAEEKFVNAGYGVNRRGIMVNDFLFVGPKSDPAGLKSAKTIGEVMTKLKFPEALFMSRGDDSGTNKKELQLWELVGGSPKRSNNYLETGQGMEATLRMAHEKNAYTLTDRGTYLSARKDIGLVPVFEGAPELLNPYSVIAVNPAIHPHTKYIEAMMFIAWITSPNTQRLIGSFKVDGEVLFNPTAVPPIGY